MKISREEMKEEALKRIEELSEVFELNPKIYNYFKEDKLYYSYATALGVMGSIDTIHYDDRYAKVAAEFEKKYNCFVYHAIEFGNSLALLYVGDNQDDWDAEHLFDKLYLMSYVYNFNNPELSEFGDIVVDCLDGALVRIR